MTYINADLFFATVQTGDQFRWRQKPGQPTNIHDGTVCTATGHAQRIDDGEQTLYVPFEWPAGRPGFTDGAVYRDMADREEYELLPKEGNRG